MRTERPGVRTPDFAAIHAERARENFRIATVQLAASLASTEPVLVAERLDADGSSSQISIDLLSPDEVARLPEAERIVFAIAEAISASRAAGRESMQRG